MASANQGKAGRWSLWRWLVVSVSLCILLFGGALSIYKMRNAGKLWLKHLNKGALLARSGDTKAAIDEYRASLAAKPDYADTYIQLANVYMIRHEFEAARRVIAEARKAAEGAPADARTAGLNPDALDYHEALILVGQAMYSLQTARPEDRLKTTEGMIQGPLADALALLAKCAPQLAKPGDAYSAMARAEELLIECHVVRRTIFEQQRKDLQAMGAVDRIAAVEKSMAQENLEARTMQLRAMADYRRVMELEPGATEPCVALARIYLGEFKPRTAEVLAMFDKLSGVDRQKPEVMQTIARAYYLASDYAKVLDVTQGAKGRDDQVAAMQGEALLNVGRVEDGWRVIEPLAARNPGSPYVIYLKGHALLLLGRYEEAVTALQNLFASDKPPQWPQARYDLAKALDEMKNPEQAVTNFRRAVEAVEQGRAGGDKDLHERREVYFNASRRLVALLAQEDPAAALNYAQKAVTMKAEDDDVWKAAQDAYRAYKKSEEDRLPAGLSPEEKVKRVRQATGQRYDELVGARLDGLLRQGECAKAERFVKDVRDQGQVEDQAKLLRSLAVGLARGGFPTRALAYYEELFRGAAADDAEARGDYAGVLVSTGRYEEAAAEAEKILATRPTNKRALTLLAESYVGRRLIPEAIAATERLYQLDENLAPQLVSLYLQARQYDKAVAVSKKLAEAHPDSLFLQARLADVYAAMGDWDAVKRTVDLIVDRWPTRQEGYLLSLIYLRDNQPEKARAAFDRGRANLPQSGRLDLLSGLVYQVEGKPKEAMQQFDRVVQRKETEELWENRMLARLMLGNLYAGEGELDKAEALNIGAMTDNPEDTMAHTSLLAAIGSLAPDQRRAAAIHINLLLAWGINKWIDLQLKEAQALAALLPDDVMVASWYAMFKARAGHVDEAIDDLEALRENAPDNSSVKFLMARLYLTLNRYGDAVPLLEELTTAPDIKVKVLVWRQLGTAYQVLGEFEKAIAAYKQAAASSDREVLALNNLAWLVGVILGRPTEALEDAQKAVERAPDNPLVVDTLGWLYHLAGDENSAVRYLMEARTGAPNHPEIRYHLGAVYHALNRWVEAKAELDEALAISPDFSSANQARALLSQITKGT